MHVFKTKSDFINNSILEIKKNAEISIIENGFFKIALSGGNTPIDIFSELKKINTNWACWKIFFCDERCLEKGHSELNSVMVYNTLLKYISIKEEHIYNIESHLGPIQAANQYNQTLKNYPAFDMTLLGIGEDGHTASLFSNNDLGERDDSPDVLPVMNSPKPPMQRVTLSVNRLRKSQNILFLVSGEGKEKILEEIINGTDYPATKLIQKQTKLFFYK